MSIERRIKDIMSGDNQLQEADQSRRLDMLVRQGLMSPAKLPILKRGLAKLNDGKAMAPNERDAVKSLLNSFMFIVLGDDAVFNRAKQNTQKNKYQQEDVQEYVEESCSCCDNKIESDGTCGCDESCDHCGGQHNVSEEFKAHDMWDPKTGEKKLAKTEKEHLALKDKGWEHEDPNQKEEQKDFNEAIDPEEDEALTDEEMETILSDDSIDTDLSEDYKTGHKSYTDAVNTAFSHHAKRDNIHSTPDHKADHIGLNSKKPGSGKTTRVNIPATHKETGKKHMIHMQVHNKGGSHPYELNTYSSKLPRKDQKESVDEAVFDRDANSNSFNRLKSKTTKVKTGEKRNPKTGKMEPVMGTTTTPQGNPSMSIKKEHVGPSPLDVWKTHQDKLSEGGFKTMATDASETARLAKKKKVGDMNPAEKSANDSRRKEYNDYQKSKRNEEVEEQGETLQEGGEVQSASGASMNKKNQMDKPVGYGIPGVKKPKKDTLVANPKSGRVRKVTKNRAASAVKKGFVYAEEWTTEDLEALFEMDYKEKFQAMLKKTGKSLADMSDEDKKKFFGAVDAAHSAKNEDFEEFTMDSFNEFTAEQEQLAIEEGAAEDARRDARKDSRGLAPTKQDKPDVSHNAKTDKSVEHIVPQLRKAMSIGKKVTFQDGKSHTISKGHAAKFLSKYMTGKPADKERMQSHGHTSHEHFKKHV